MSVAATAVVSSDAQSVRTIFGASAAGASHIRRNTPCQDAFRVLEHGDAFAIAVADGLGSAKRSQLGSQLAVDAAAARALQFADDDPTEAALEAMLAARTALEVAALYGSFALRDLGCTLLVVAGNAERIGIAHIGDGAVVGRARGGSAGLPPSDEEWFVLSPPGPSEYLNETDPLTAHDWERRVRTVCALDGIDGLALFTDGSQHAALRHDGMTLRAHGGFFAPLFDFACSGVDDATASAALEKLLSGRKLGEHSDDDKTLVLAVL